jgi:VIT1/CCC1 family predicted Fe2+/Mn2+ transporter
MKHSLKTGLSFRFALTFTIPIFLFELSTAIVVSVLWGLCILGLISLSIAKEQGTARWKVVSEHLAIGLLVVGVTHYVGDWIGKVCG